MSIGNFLRKNKTQKSTKLKCLTYLETNNQDNKISNNNPHYLQALLLLRAENQKHSSSTLQNKAKIEMGIQQKCTTQENE